MIEVVSILCACGAVWLWISPRTPAERINALRPPGSASNTTSLAKDAPAVTEAAPDWLESGAVGGADRRTLLSGGCAGLFVGAVVGGVTGIVAGVVVAVVVVTLVHRRVPPEVRRDRERITADLPFAADLMVSCLQAGQPVSAATEIAAEAIGGPLGRRLAWVSGQLRLGADPEPAWATLGGESSMGQLSRAMSRAAQSGAPVADVLTRLADDARQSAHATAVAAARRVGVQAVAPLGLCFLPAFVLLGIIPVVAGLASAVVFP